MTGLVLTGTTAADTIHGGSDDDTISGLAGNDLLYGEAGHDSIDAGSGADGVDGGAGNDVIAGGTGNDQLWGSGGSDTFRYASGDGSDIIYEGFSSTDVDSLKLTDLNPGSVALTSSGNDLIVTDKATNQTVTVQNFLLFASGAYGGIEKIQFADNSIWDRTNIVSLLTTGVTQFAGAPILGGSGADSLAGTSSAEGLFGYGGADTLSGLADNDRLYGDVGNDSIDGGAGNDGIDGGADNDLIDGGAGNDQLWGGGGSDTFFYAASNGPNLASGGSDIIYEGFSSTDVDILKLTDLNPGSVALTSSGNDLIVTDKATSQTVTVQNFLLFGSGAYGGIEQIQFADNSVWDRTNINSFLTTGVTQFAGAPIFGGSGADSLAGTSSAEGLFGYGGADTLSGMADNDRLYGDVGNDSIDGGAGNDGIDGGADNDIIAGGLGNDQLWGSGGSDTFRYASGDGNDIIYEGYSSTDVDILKLTDLNPGSVALTSSGNDLIITDKATGATVTVQNFLFFGSGSYGGIEQIQFADNSIWDRTNINSFLTTGVTQFAGAPIFGGSGADSLAGTSAAEGLFGYGGADTLTGLADNDRLYGDVGNDSIDGGSGSDSIDGGADNDLIVGGTGNDQMWGSGGSDTFRYASGDGSDTVIEGTSSTDTDILLFTDLNRADLTIVRSGNNLLITITSTSEIITIYDQYAPAGSPYGIEQMQFQDGSTLLRADFLV